MEEAAGERLSMTTLRDFRPSLSHEKPDYDLPSYRVTLSLQDAPIPVLLRHALNLIGMKPTPAPGKKWPGGCRSSTRATCGELAHQKFGLRLRIRGNLSEEQADDLLTEIAKKLLSAVTTVEALLVETSRDTLNAGDVTVVNQHRQLRRAYDYFRERATNPEVVEDVSESGKSAHGSWSTFRAGKDVMAMNSFHDLVAAISAYVSSLEHDLVLVLPFLDFAPSTDDLTRIIGDTWGRKWRRVVGHSDPKAVRLRERLAAVVERWRNPYSHGGFEKGHGATIYVHTPGLGALPVGLSAIRESPLFSFHPASETDVEGVFSLFDEIDTYLVEAVPHAMGILITAGLDVRFDTDFKAQVVDCIVSDGDLGKLIEAYQYQEDTIANMDF